MKTIDKQYAELANTIAAQAEAIALGKIPADQLRGHVALLESSIATLKAWTPAKVAAVEASTPAKRISAKYVGETLTLAFYGPYDRTTEEHTLVKFEGAGDDARATFRDVSGMEWEAYRFKGRWAYGSSANRLTVVN